MKKAVIAAVALLLASPGFATTLKGKVLDHKDQPVVSAVVQVFSIGAEKCFPAAPSRALFDCMRPYFLQSAQTGLNGVYEIPDLEPGRYEIVAHDVSGTNNGFDSGEFDIPDTPEFVLKPFSF